MKFAAIAILSLAVPASALAQAAPAAAPAAAAKFNLNTPIEQIVADPKGKAALDTDLPGTTTHPEYEMFKGMSLNQVVPFAGGQLTPERLKKVEASLAAIK